MPAFILVFTVLAATDRIANAAFAGIPIGLVLTLIHLVGIPAPNTSVKPARGQSAVAGVAIPGRWTAMAVWRLER